MIVRWLCLRLSLTGREVCCSEFCRLVLLLFGVVIFVVVCWFVFGLWWWACCGLVGLGCGCYFYVAGFGCFCLIVFECVVAYCGYGCYLRFVWVCLCLLRL